MAIFRKKQDDPLNQKAQQIEAELANIKALRQKLEQSGTINREFIKPQQPTDNCHLFIEGKQPFLEEQENLNVKKISEFQPDSAKYDLFGKIKKRLGIVEKTESEKAKLIQTLMAGSVQGPPLLKYEQRVARNRFLLLFTIFIIILIGVLSLVTKVR